MTLSVVIPTLDEADQVVRAIESARAPGVEIVVVDGGSADATCERAAAAGARVIPSEVGRACQLASGVRATRGDVVLFLHADTQLPPGYHEEVSRSMSDAGTVAGAFRLRFDRAGFALRVVEWGARLRFSFFSMPYGDQAVFVRRETLYAIGGVPQAPIMEDMDLIREVSQRGRIARLELPVVTSARRYIAGGVYRTMLRHWIATAGWVLGIDRSRIANWYRR